MNIPLSNDCSLVSDANCIWIERTKTAKSGKTYTEVVCGYHINLRNLMTAYTRKRVRLSEAETLEALAADIERVEGEVKALAEAAELLS